MQARESILFSSTVSEIKIILPFPDGSPQVIRPLPFPFLVILLS